MNFVAWRPTKASGRTASALRTGTADDASRDAIASRSTGGPIVVG